MLRMLNEIFDNIELTTGGKQILDIDEGVKFIKKETASIPTKRERP